MTDAAWREDPSGKDELRYWDGTTWTEHVWTAGSQRVRRLAMHQRREVFGTWHDHPSAMARRRLAIAIGVLLLVVLLLLMTQPPAGTS